MNAPGVRSKDVTAETPMTRTTVYIADDHGLVPEGLAAVLDRDPDIDVVGLGATGREAIAAARKLSPTVIVMDVAMTDMNGMEATREVLRHAPACLVVAVSSHSDHNHVVGMLKAGATGYVLKTEAYSQLRHAIDEALQGNVYLSPSVGNAVVDMLRSSAGGPTALELLSDRERQIVQLVAEGHSSTDIGAMLNISASTVETHRRNVLRKLDLHNVAELTRFAIREGLTHVDG